MDDEWEVADGVGSQVGEGEDAAGGVGASCRGKDANAQRFEAVPHGPRRTAVAEQQGPFVLFGKKRTQGGEKASCVGIGPFPTAVDAAQGVHRSDGSSHLGQPREVGEKGNFVRDGHIHTRNFRVRGIPGGEILRAFEFKNPVGGAVEAVALEEAGEQIRRSRVVNGAAEEAEVEVGCQLEFEFTVYSLSLQFTV